MEKFVLWLTEKDQGFQKEPKLIPCVESSLRANWDWLVHKKYDDGIMFEFKKESGEIITLIVGDEITDDLIPLIEGEVAFFYFEKPNF